MAHVWDYKLILIWIHSKAAYTPTNMFTHTCKHALTRKQQLTWTEQRIDMFIDYNRFQIEWGVFESYKQRIVIYNYDPFKFN